ncbi:hypothetical protein Gohar_000888 [Gossypium harknessii]|uniref:RNase H type-1 domain-containing protein n=1 Tax=Gossypium harknessii TaxID=34285 RepID=A0A7J9I245_9ROSI|nr:hypothetical protein [Gossypium harknessii]
MRNIKDPTMIEAYACLQVVVFVEEMGFRDVEVEGDSLTYRWTKKGLLKEKGIGDSPRLSPEKLRPFGLILMN